MTPAELTDQVLQAYGDTPDPRLRELISALIAHVHAFAVQTRLTPQEWLAGVQFLTATGHKCDSERQEFVLLSDVLGVSSLVDLINSAAGVRRPATAASPRTSSMPTTLISTVTPCLALRTLWSGPSERLVPVTPDVSYVAEMDFSLASA
jgi:hypothetical protein